MQLKKYNLLLPAILAFAPLSLSFTADALAEATSYSALESKYSKSPENVKAAQAYAKSALSWGKYDTAIAVYQGLLDSTAPKVVAKQNKIRVDLAKIYLSVDNFEAAKKLLEEAKESEPTKKDAKKIKKLLKTVTKKTKSNKFAGSFGIAATTTSNIAKTSSGFDSFEEIESDDVEEDGGDDFGGDDDFLDDLEDDIEIDDEDLADQSVEDLDGDGIDDDFDQDVDAVDEDGDGEADSEDDIAGDDDAADDENEDDVADAGDDAAEDTEDEVADNDDDATDDAGNDADDTVEAENFVAKKGTASTSKKKSKQSDVRYAAKLGFKHGYLLSPKGHTWNSGVIFAGSMDEKQDNVDRGNVLVGTGPIINISSLRLKINPSINYIYLNKDSKDITESVIPSISTTFKATPTLTLAARYNYETRDFYAEGTPDVDIDTFKVAAKYKLTKKDVIGLSYSPKIEDSSKSTKNKDQHGVGASYTHEFPLKIFASVKGDYKEITFDNASPVKEDEELSGSLVLGKKVTKDLSVFVGVNSKDRESNIAGKSSNVTTFVGGAGYKF